MPERVGRVRPQFEAWYPQLLPGFWYPADRLRATVLRQLHAGEPRWEPQGRVPSDEHFEFRGGEPDQRSSRRTRRDDTTPMPDGMPDRRSP